MGLKTNPMAPNTEAGTALIAGLIIMMNAKIPKTSIGQSWESIHHTIICRHSGGGRYRHHSPDARDRYR